MNETNNGLESVKRAATQWLLLPDSGLAIEVLLAAVVANRLEGDPFWLFLVNPPGSVKTELINTLSEVPDVYPLSDLTAQTLASGYKSDTNEETSLLFKLQQNKKSILALKDFTTVLSAQKDTQAQILAQFREIYDGAYKKNFGTGKVVDWTGKLGLIAGVTPIIDRASAVNQVLGERFVFFRIQSADRIAVARRALHNQGQEKEMRRTLRATITAFLQSVTLAPVSIPEELKERLAHLADFCAVARSNAIRDYRGEIEYVPDPEGPARLMKQLAIFGKALALVRGKQTLGAEEYAVTHRLVWDSLHSHKSTLLRYLHATDAAQIAGLSTATALPQSTIRRYLEELVAFGLVIKQLAGGNEKAAMYRLSESCAKTLEIITPRRNEEEACSRAVADSVAHAD